MNSPSRINRRTFLRTTALAALAPAGNMTLHGANPEFIDAHVHVWTPDTQGFPLAPGFTKEKAMKPASFTSEELFTQCRPQGVNRVVLIQMSFYKFDNRYMLEAIARHPG